MPSENTCPLRPVSVDFTLQNGGAIYKGSCWEVDLEITERDTSTKAETAFDLTGYTAVCQIRNYSGASSVLATPSVTIEDNRVTMSLDDYETSMIPACGRNYYEASTYPYDLFLEKDGQRYKVLQGFVDVSPSITTKESV